MRPKIFRGILPLKKVGTSLGIIIPKVVRNITNVIENELIGIKIWKISSKEFKCSNCKQLFFDYINSKNHDCPFCGDKFELVKGGKNKKVKMSDEDNENEVEDLNLFIGASIGGQSNILLYVDFSQSMGTNKAGVQIGNWDKSYPIEIGSNPCKDGIDNFDHL